VIDLLRQVGTLVTPEIRRLRGVRNEAFHTDQVGMSVLEHRLTDKSVDRRLFLTPEHDGRLEFPGSFSGGNDEGNRMMKQDGSTAEGLKHQQEWNNEQMNE
jgi:hypothetical protein